LFILKTQVSRICFILKYSCLSLLIISANSYSVKEGDSLITIHPTTFAALRILILGAPVRRVSIFPSSSCQSASSAIALRKEGFGSHAEVKSDTSILLLPVGLLF
jgi:hypothetical protein